MPLEGAKLPRDGGEPLGVAPGHETGSPVSSALSLSGVVAVIGPS